MVQIFEDDTSDALSGEFWGESGRTDWLFNITAIIQHSDPTMELGIKGFFRSDENTYWIRNLQVDFFGCFNTCSDCTVDNSPVHCTACQDGYYLSGSECKPCGVNCDTCIDSADNCLTCSGGKLIKSGNCVATCDLGFYLEVDNSC